ncbi:MAG: hemerythrin family protein [Gammaproteobacteria bacterium]|nr:hemerythrin family protein [Gammaproteobacteria bacterium]MBU1645588.1 hemerythrin family protein [Gammaproteobacteria bacterium]MBU1973610.1 hemerythrin family protein [Gammaproteobacteria bacterium]
MGNETLDDQHRNIVALCNALADCLADAGEEGDGDEADRKFRKVFDELMALSREHFAAEEALLAASGYPMLDEHRNERDEFDYLAAEIITTENFDKDELQSFLALWWTGHILGSAKKQRAFLAQQPVA